ELDDDGDLYQATPWTAEEAYRFLRDVPAFESAGIVVRVPDWWRARRKVQVSVKIGSTAPSLLGMNALVDFQVALALDGEPVSEPEWHRILASASSLALV